ncbi:MAG: acyl-CoA thioesterase [Actinomycetota bacterium]|jgi:acyl-CoA thioesterase-2
MADVRVDRLLHLLTLEPTAAADAFRAPVPDEGPERLFGGHVAAQALRAATLTVDDDRPPHSLHAYFIRPGRLGDPLELRVDRTRDGRSFTTRRVEVNQSGETIFVLAASFAAAEEGDDWQLPAPTNVPDPDEVGGGESPISKFTAMSPFELRPVVAPAPGEFPIIHPFWVRTVGPLPDDAAVHACALTYMSDMGVVGSARAPVSTLPKMFMGASLDHAVWFHRPVRADEWLLFSVDPVSNAASRGLARGTFHTAEGVLVASVAQEALLRSTGRTPLP